jgi:hypothetical protein
VAEEKQKRLTSKRTFFVDNIAVSADFGSETETTCVEQATEKVVLGGSIKTFKPSIKVVSHMTIEPKIILDEQDEPRGTGHGA